MPLTDSQLRWLRLEWLTARVLLVLGLVVIAAGFFAPVSFRNAAQQNETASQPAPSDSSPGRVFCGTAVAVAQNYGILPNGVRANALPRKTDIQGRYVCEADSGSASYAVAVELECANIRDQACFNLFAVRQADGTLLYQKQQ